MKKIMVLVSLLIVTLLMTACSRSVEEIEVTWDGNECTVTGPTKLPAGEHSFLFKDQYEKTRTGLYVSRLTDGHTYQDLIEPQDEPGDYYPKPDWVIYATKVDIEIISGGEKRVTYALEQGEHAIYVSPGPDLWFCVPLMVVEPTSG